jgi:hypothetical protein
MKNKHKPRDSYAWGDDPVIEDGGSVRVPITLCDANKLLGHRPGWIAPLSEEQIAARQEMIDRQREAWRGPGMLDDKIHASICDRRKRPPDDDPDDDDEDQDIADARRFASREAYVARLGDAWRTPVVNNLPPTKRIGRDAAEPDNSSSAETMRRHLRVDDPDDAQARRDAAAAEYAASLSNAWRSPSGAMPPARMPEPGRRDPQALGEQWRGGR